MSLTPTCSLVHALEVLPGGRIDFDPLPLLDEERDVHRSTGRELRGLGRPARGVAFHARLAGDDLEDDVGRELDADGVAVEERDVDVHALAQPALVVPDLVGLDMNLVTGRG